MQDDLATKIAELIVSLRGAVSGHEIANRIRPLLRTHPPAVASASWTVDAELLAAYRKLAQDFHQFRHGGRIEKCDRESCKRHAANIARAESATKPAETPTVEGWTPSKARVGDMVKAFSEDRPAETPKPSRYKYLDSLGKRISDLTADVAARDAKIAELEGRVKELELQIVCTTDSRPIIADLAAARREIETLRSGANLAVDLLNGHRGEYAHCRCCQAHKSLVAALATSPSQAPSEKKVALSAYPTPSNAATGRETALPGNLETYHAAE